MATAVKRNIHVRVALEPSIGLFKQPKMIFPIFKFRQIHCAYLNFLRKVESCGYFPRIYLDGGYVIYIKSKMRCRRSFGRDEERAAIRGGIVRVWWNTKNSKTRLTLYQKSAIEETLCGRSRQVLSNNEVPRAILWFRWSMW